MRALENRQKVWRIERMPLILFLSGFARHKIQNLLVFKKTGRIPRGGLSCPFIRNQLDTDHALPIGFILVAGVWRAFWWYVAMACSCPYVAGACYAFYAAPK